MNIGLINGQFVLEGTKIPDDGLNFSTNELAEAYVMASSDSIEESEPVAGSRIRAWLRQETTMDGKAFYSEWRENLGQLGNTVRMVPEEFKALSVKSEHSSKIESSAAKTSVVPEEIPVLDSDPNDTKSYEPKPNSFRTFKRFLLAKK